LETYLKFIMAGFDAPTGPTASPLGQAWGYGIVLGIGFLFALGMVVSAACLFSYCYTDTGEDFHHLGSQTLQQ
jgi:hypothetical protein